MIQDYFGQTIGNVKRAMLTYGPSGRSRGTATIVFRKGDAGQKAVKQLDGVKVDGKPMRVELVVGATEVPKAPAPKGLADRVAQQPKSAAREKNKPKTSVAAAATTNGATKTKAKKPARSGRPKKKTAEELDAEMMDYFGGEAPATTTTTAQPAAATTTTGGDAMVDEVL
ncbi:RNA-binding RNA annealing protein [Saxophila tyrrhenica]|uniref:RNA-binding RNA annealing protein n=1 Tax=Saxophila tyrrhenica TaxID=1690608 RepID=A0AAV9P222_9PEZI|nr:RNA-binding RNA annealing protein [Saxophila tyrrhenica]